MRSRTPIKIYFKAFVALLFKVFVEDCVDCNFQKTLENNEQLRKESSEIQDQHKAKIKETTLHQLQLLRKKLLRSFIVILSAIIFGFLCITVLSKTTIKDMLSANRVFILLSMVSFSWATLGRLGWEGQTCAGDTVIEELDKFIFKSLYWLGTLFAVFAIMPRNTSIEAVAESSLPDSKTLYYTYSTIAQTLAGAFGILGAFVLFRLQSINRSCENHVDNMSVVAQFFPNNKASILHQLREKKDWKSYAIEFMSAFSEYEKTQREEKTSKPKNLPRYKEYHSLLIKDIRTKTSLKRDLKITLKLTALAIILSLILLAVVPHLADNSFFFYIPLILSVGLSAGCVFLYARLIIKTFEV